ncbi:fimbrial protein [Enterobacter sp. ENT03]|uniref:fimbrial protein n=1 Tax=Enterobacter sp. ENT03 TaxID=2854780 RepID=UPI001C46B38A|nr:fimbrial protein [Enterobacter sp. ENT03]
MKKIAYRKLVPITAMFCMAGFGSLAHAEVTPPTVLNYDAKLNVTPGTCTFENDTDAVGAMTFAFGNVTVAQAFAGYEIPEQSIKFDINCQYVVKTLKVSLSAPHTKVVSGKTWIAPDASVAANAKNVAFLTQVKNGLTDTYTDLEATNTPSADSSLFEPKYSIYMKAKIIPTVATLALLEGGSLDASATLNIEYQ